ncbi:MAG TPA: SNF2-related protein, partial [Candidatus Thermoplasmatota archaeon]|nr:SNF2-related protein [Candidatus Thermoplasmatota archaeon]
MDGPHQKPIIEIDKIPEDSFRLAVRVPRLNHILTLMERIPGIRLVQEDPKKFVDPWKRENTPVTGTIPASQTPMLSILMTYYPVELKFYNDTQKFVLEPPPDLTVDKVDEETISLRGLFREQDRFNNNFQKVATRQENNLFHASVKSYIAAIKYAERDIINEYGRNYDGDFRLSTYCTPEAIAVIEKYKVALEGFRKGEHISRGSIGALQLKRPLREYQKTAVDFLEFNNGCGLIADEMGLGKTMTAISYAELIKAKKILVVCPANVKYTWQEEILMASTNPGKIKVLEGRKENTKKSTKIAGNERWVIMNYDIAIQRTSQVKQISWDVIIFDESHYIKNYDAKRTKACREFNAPHRIALTGTPILNRPEEFWVTLSWLNPVEWGNDSRGYHDFKWRYGTHGYDGDQKDEFLMELNGRLKNVMLRRLKTEVEDLPAKIRQVRHVALHSTEMATYRKKEQELWAKIAPLLYQIDRKKQEEILMALQTLKRYASLAKTPLTMEILREVLEAGGKIVLFSEFLDTLNALQNVLKKEQFATYRVDGSVTGEHRFEQVK